MDIQNRAFMAIGPCRIAAMALLNLRNGNHGALQTDIPAIREQSIKRLQNAYDMLDRHLPQFLKEHGHRWPDSLQAQQENCPDAFQPLLPFMRSKGAVEFGTNDLGSDIAVHCFCVFEPCISEFLKDMTDDLRSTQSLREATRHKELLATIQQAESTGRHIQMISLNATIEAARLGDSGRGFSLIATEIRGLSDKTQTLLEEITVLMRP